MKRPELNKKIGAKITSLRNGRDVKVFADICGISPTNMYKEEAGKKGYRVESIASICEGNNITLAEFFVGM
jgi:hypothetical protein